MKIGLVRRGYSPTGGAEAYLVRLAESLQCGGHEPVLVTTDEWPHERWVNSRIVRLEGSDPIRFARAFARTDTGCDVHLSLERVPGCEVYRAGDGVHAAWLDRRGKFEPVWKRMTRWLNRKHAQFLRLEREVFDPAGTRAIIANSQMVRDEILARFPFPAERIHVIHNGLAPRPASTTRSAARVKLGLDPSRYCALFVGTGWDRKGLATAVQAATAHAGTTLLVAGKGPEEKFRSATVRFLGPLADLSVPLAAADVFLLPTWYDPFSNACLEAMAAGLPVLTTPGNGFSEIVQPGVHGSVVPAGDAAGFARELEFWRTRALGARTACLERAGEFTIARNMSATVRVLESAAG